MADKENRRITDVGTLKALGHPLRMKLYRALLVAGAATASQLGEQVDEAPSLVSYHLRRLADHGLIEEAEPRSGDGRERWWQPASDGVSVRGADFRDAPEKETAHLAFTRLYVDQRTELYRRYLDGRAAWPAEWNDAVVDAEGNLRLTAAELASLRNELLAVIRKYDEKGRADEAAGDTEGRENVAVHVYGFPFRV
ncbi:ArsR/SmtB family transcription factor [Streptomyces triticiradicis]|uniref:Helix-turn-helix domain-containing protein n=1 Tax=Streptomyces triticiradicis TaxID=2651189 RepID=A0A7J5DHG3_9ACTN|nr:helix-turn-helix domain-containing protein [Streptomyces triticiradicis]KAB1988079.1 helix-turn-helix domain-containing protein [Streptomyces triticiradicis]